MQLRWIIFYFRIQVCAGMEYKTENRRGSWTWRALSVAALLGLGLPLAGSSWLRVHEEGKVQRVVKWRDQGKDSLVIQDGAIAFPKGFPASGEVRHSAVFPGTEGWVVFNDGAIDALAGTLWSWHAATEKWQERLTTGEQPDLALPHANFIEGHKLQRVSMGDELAVHELNLTSGTWTLRLRSSAADWKPVAGPFDLDQFVVWASAGQTLHVLDKRTEQLATFPSDAWAAHLMRAEEAEVLRMRTPNVLEFGMSSDALNRFDFNEKVRYASFASPFDWVLPSSVEEQDGGVLSNWAFWLLLGTWTAFAAWWWRSRGMSREAASSAVVGGFAYDAVVSKDAMDSIAHWSEPLKAIVLSDQTVFTAGELDELFAIADIASPETLRAKRSRMIQGVNTEFNLLFGYDLIRRKRDENDRRKVLYTRNGLPPQLAKGLHRNRVHELHANDRADRTDRVSEDS